MTEMTNPGATEHNMLHAWLHGWSALLFVCAATLSFVSITIWACGGSSLDLALLLIPLALAIMMRIFAQLAKTAI